jgi:hypothetical protein
VPDGSEEPKIDWQAECFKARQTSDCFRQLYLEAVAHVADLRVELTLRRRDTE